MPGGDRRNSEKERYKKEKNARRREREREREKEKKDRGKRAHAGIQKNIYITFSPAFIAVDSQERFLIHMGPI